MIREGDISTVLMRHLEGMAGLPDLVFENKDSTLTPPYVVFENVRVSRKDKTISGGQAESRGYLWVTVVRPLNEWVTEAENLADDISEHFSYPTSFLVIGGKITITKPPEIKQGYRDGAKWRTPVKIDYLAK